MVRLVFITLKLNCCKTIILHSGLILIALKLDELLYECFGGVFLFLA